MSEEFVAAKNAFYRAYGTDQDGYLYIMVDEGNNGADYGEPSEELYSSLEEAISAATADGGGPFSDEPPDWTGKDGAN
jgi:exopolysaccharide biosynthesis protein